MQVEARLLATWRAGFDAFRQNGVSASRLLSGTPALGRVNSATSGSRRSRIASGSTAAICISRATTRFLSLQLKARYEGIPTPLYGLRPVDHKA